ncbi:hypothetical protein F511_05540 [Dorcoceras hygrometricum]|uniref:Uncharacterized protein n=1 Tax=Dorcoceras hygrometricum TaxID=472368 RepID=A0A2Z7BA35_9LAMI|nr:hypothetical protein F511_05540 [Dorcoceras hygrometricum]
MMKISSREDDKSKSEKLLKSGCKRENKKKALNSSMSKQTEDKTISYSTTADAIKYTSWCKEPSWLRTNQLDEQEHNRDKSRGQEQKQNKRQAKRFEYKTIHRMLFSIQIYLLILSSQSTVLTCLKCRKTCDAFVDEGRKVLRELIRLAL